MLGLATSNTSGGDFSLQLDRCVPVCAIDLNGDGLLNFFDVSLFLGAYTDSDPLADFTGDGLFNFFDVGAFIGAFNAGCP